MKFASNESVRAKLRDGQSAARYTIRDGTTVIAVVWLLIEREKDANRDNHRPGQ